MTTLKQIADKLNNDLETSFPRDVLDIDIGDYTFTQVKPIDDEGFVYLYTNPNNPNVKLLYNEDRQSFVRYILNDDGMVDMKSWRMGKTFEKRKAVGELSNIF